MILSFNTLKNRAKKEFLQKAQAHKGMPVFENIAFLALAAATGSNQKPKEIFDEWINYGLNIIDHWDVRGVKQLIQLYPNIVPKKNRKHIYSAYQNDQNVWMIEYPYVNEAAMYHPGM